ncbi:MAG: radical SAM protein [Desulfobacteraceae bacterium IS3]|nr:MAG: radical SAM protein [Desulfobacteraceae bacterium IS3]
MSSSFQPVYIRTAESGLLKQKINAARNILTSCTLCPRKCRINRPAGETGVCKTGEKAWVSSFGPHFGEERPLVGHSGSGTIFFTHCNLLCIFCQNYDISHQGDGDEVSDETIAEMMMSLQNSGCHNINFVTPSHVVPQILSAVEIAIGYGLSVPLIYNTGAYDNVETLKFLDGVIDIYMPDFKFWDTEVARATCNAGDYPEIARLAVKEMYRQTGDLTMDDSGIARRGLLVRHLVMPDGLAGTREVMRFIASEISTDTYVNIMSQYRPCGRANEIDVLNRRPTRIEFDTALEIAKEEGIHIL